MRKNSFKKKGIFAGEGMKDGENTRFLFCSRISEFLLIPIRTSGKTESKEAVSEEACLAHVVREDRPPSELSSVMVQIP